MSFPACLARPRLSRFVAGSRRCLLTTTANHASASASSPTLSSSATPIAPRLRFAPSPTGHLHLGGLRTALFNHLFARRYNGSWILRIEDTDQSRLVPGATDALQEVLEWCGLDWDEGPGRTGGSCGPWIQSERLEIHRQYAEKLIATGKAYRDFRTEGFADSAGSDAAGPSRQRGRGPRIVAADDYVPPDEDEARALIRDGRSFVVRFKMPSAPLTHSDLVYGPLNFPADVGASDPILLKSDGWPTYHLANVVDDHLMGVTHVLRGEEWLPSVPKHLALYEALGLAPPVFAHLPLLVNKDGSKLSKRSGDVHVAAYRAAGWEPEALVNWVALLGYNHHGQGPARLEGNRNEDGEVLSMQDLIASFDPKRISHSRATPDAGKLAFLNRRHLFAPAAQKARSDLVPRLREILEKQDGGARWSDEYLAKVLNIVSERAEKLCEVPAEADYLLIADDALPKWPASFEERDVAVLRTAHEALAMLPSSSWQAASLQGALDATAAHAPSRKVALRATRVALTGRKAGPTLVDIMEVMGRERTLSRLDAALARGGAKGDAAR